MKDFKCCICKKQITGEWGNNPWGAVVHRDVGTDSEGVSYNSCEWN